MDAYGRAQKWFQNGGGGPSVAAAMRASLHSTPTYRHRNHRTSHAAPLPQTGLPHLMHLISFSAREPTGSPGRAKPGVLQAGTCTAADHAGPIEGHWVVGTRTPGAERCICASVEAGG